MTPPQGLAYDTVPRVDCRSLLCLNHKGMDAADHATFQNLVGKHPDDPRKVTVPALQQDRVTVRDRLGGDPE